MKIIHIGTYDLKGGAAKSSYRLHKSLLRSGEDSSLLVRNKLTTESDVIEFRPPSGIFNSAYRLVRRLGLYVEGSQVRNRRRDKSEVFTNARTQYGSQLARAIPNCDIVNLHWVSGFVDTTRLFAYVKTPVVWTLHDMNAFTGGCHFDQGCGKFESQCGACPQLESRGMRDFSRTVLMRKERAYRPLVHSRLRVVCPSKWLAGEVKKSTLMARFDTHVIPYGVDTKVFAPREAGCLRRAFNIPAEARVILFVADHLSSYRKGFDLLMDTLGHGSRVPSVLVSVGNAKSLTKRLSENVLCIGNVENETMLSMLYSMADLFVITARQDNMPNTVLESLACGTPVLGFHAGGIPEMITQGEQGYLVPVGETKGLWQAIDAVMQDNTKLRQMSRACRDTAVEKFDSDVQAQRYIDFYSKLLTYQ